MPNNQCTSSDEVEWITRMKMPLLFIGHGSPMNAIAENSFTNTLNNYNIHNKKKALKLSI